MRESDVWLFRIGAAILTFVAVFFGCVKGGRYLHEKDAYDRAHRERSEKETRDDAIFLRDGYNDTQGYRELCGYLSVEEATSGYAKKHELEVHAVKIAGGAAVLVALLLGESARLWARKRDAKRQMSRR